MAPAPASPGGCHVALEGGGAAPCTGSRSLGAGKRRDADPDRRRSATAARQLPRQRRNADLTAIWRKGPDRHWPPIGARCCPRAGTRIRRMPRTRPDRSCRRRDLSRGPSKTLTSWLERSCRPIRPARPREESIRPCPEDPGHPRSVVVVGRPRRCRWKASRRCKASRRLNRVPSCSSIAAFHRWHSAYIATRYHARRVMRILRR